jgi:para-aminobenzoate synthetase component 2
MQVIRDCAAAALPMLGVCLGHQALGEVFGGTVTHAPELMHGKTSQVEHHGAGVLAGLPTPFTATRYHSLAVVDGTISDELEVTATVSTAHGPIIMGLQHRTLPLHGVQFHPESVLTEGGHRLLANWLTLCGSDTAIALSAPLHPLLHTPTPAR